jgi:predicted aspartyl protease
LTRSGSVEGQAVSNILIDTGCSQSIVREELVPQERLLGEAVTIRCAHGDVVLYPLAMVEIQIDNRTMELQVAVSDTLPVDVLLGTDAPGFATILDIVYRRQRRLWWLQLVQGNSKNRKKMNSHKTANVIVGYHHTGYWKLMGSPRVVIRGIIISPSTARGKRHLFSSSMMSCLHREANPGLVLPRGRREQLNGTSFIARSMYVMPLISTRLNCVSCRRRTNP